MVHGGYPRRVEHILSAVHCKAEMDTNGSASGDDTRPAPERWKAQREFRERQRVRSLTPCASHRRAPPFRSSLLPTP